MGTACTSGGLEARARFGGGARTCRSALFCWIDAVSFFLSEAASLATSAASRICVGVRFWPANWTASSILLKLL